MTMHDVIGRDEGDSPRDDSNLPVPRAELGRIVGQRDRALQLIRDAAAGLDAAWNLSAEAVKLVSAASGGHKFYHADHDDRADYQKLFRDHFEPDASIERFRRKMDADVWHSLVERMGLKHLMDTTARKELDESLMAEVPEVTFDNVTATFEQLVGDADLMFQRGLARVFAELDERFKSHDAFKIGSRMILTYAFDDWGHLSYGGRARDKLTDVERVLAVLDGQTPSYSLITALERDRGGAGGPRQTVTEGQYLRIRGFKNGNAHLWFTRDDLVEKANKVLAAYYGEVLPDAAGEDMPADGPRSTAVARELQFYWTPPAAAEEALSAVYIRGGSRVLEPSAGEGHLVRALLDREAVASVDCVEFNPDRAHRIREIADHRVHVTTANFLRMTPNPVYDLVLMNPPFYGTHWMDHVRHAFDFLAEGGQLVAILPVTARISETPLHLSFRRWAEERRPSRWDRRQFNDLPPESFAEAGTRIHTTVLRLCR